VKQIQWIKWVAKSWRVLGAFVLVFNLAPSEQSHDRGRLVYTDHAGDVYVYDFNQNSPQPVTKRGSAWIIDEDFVLVQRCFYPPSEFMCPPVRQIVRRQDAERLNIAHKFWQDDYSAPMWSPDGSNIAFLKYVFEPDSPYPKRYNFHLINADGTDMRDPTPDEDDDSFWNSWSPDSREIAYLCGRENYFCIVNADATNLRKIEVKANGDIYALAWSPDGSLIASLLYYEDPRHYELCIMNSDGSNPRLLWDTETQLSNLVWSPDNTRFALEGKDTDRDKNENSPNTDIYVVNADGSNLLNLTNTEESYDISPTWSPNSSQIAYFSDGGRSLYIVNADGRSSPLLIAEIPYAYDSPLPSLFWIP
jgi:Tol biopolymer transport system component